MRPFVRCSNCNALNFRRCGCPWDKPFEEWPKRLLNRLQAMVIGGWRGGA